MYRIYSIYEAKKNKAIPEDNKHSHHLDEATAKKVMAKIKFTDEEGVLHTKPPMTIEEIDGETCHLKFPEGTTLYDKWVAFNFFYADVCRANIPISKIIEGAYYFYFKDEDAPTDKLYRYLRAMGAL